MAIFIGEKILFKQGFVFGKYYPLHNGHLALIKYAESICKQLVVIVCASSRELIGSNIRAGWLKEELATFTNITVLTYDYDETDLPNTSVSSWDVSKVWSKVFKGLVPQADLVVTSEPYGDYVAQYMGITHMAFDQKRLTSSTLVRKNRIEQWSFLPSSVKKHLQKTIFISGAESTGKTIMAERLANHYGATLVSETGRKIIKNSNSFTQDDLYLVAEEHANLISSAKLTLSPLVIVDTDIYVTQSYCHFVFGDHLNIDPKIYSINSADLRLFLSTDVPFVQDGTRMGSEFREGLSVSHERVLFEYGQGYEMINGDDWDRRFVWAVELIDSMIFGDHAMK